MQDDTPQLLSQATSILAACFFRILASGATPFESFEDKAIALGHKAIASAMGAALERYDRLLCADLPDGVSVHDARSRTLATEVGDISFSQHRLRSPQGSFAPLSEALDLPWSCRISPGATSFLIEAGAEVSYLKASRLLARKGGSKVSPTAVMNALRSAGARCERDDEASACNLFEQGVLPDGKAQADELCVEADGTWIRLQGEPEDGPERVEIKALVAYESKQAHGSKTRRTRCVRHGCVAAPQTFWLQGIAAIGTAYDLSKVERVHLGTDGEGWCKRGGAYLPMRMQVTGHLDPFHVNRAVLSCFDDAKAGWRVLEVLLDGDKDEAIALLKASLDAGIAREKNTLRVIGYLKNNKDLIGIEGPSLGTMESENQHLYSSRMESVPCAWSRQGASDMARIRSRIYSGRRIPRLTRKESASPRRRKRDEARKIKNLPKTLAAGSVLQSSGHGYLPKQASVANMSAEVRFAAGVDSGMSRYGG